MKRVYLLRHAKPSWKHPELADRDRPPAGAASAPQEAIAKHMRARSIEPDLVLCSTARRAHDTLERIEPRSARGGRAVRDERRRAARAPAPAAG